MELDRFQTILNAYGAAPERWPVDERDAALALTRASVNAARALAKARALDTSLQTYADSRDMFEADRFDRLHARIVRAAQPTMQSWMGRWFGVSLTPRQLWPSLAGLAMASVLGFVAGFGGVLQTESNHDVDDGLAFSSTDLSIGGQ